MAKQDVGNALDRVDVDKIEAGVFNTEWDFPSLIKILLGSMGA